MKTVFVTTGATVSFDPLIKAVLNIDTMHTLLDQGYEHIIIQYGPSETLFNELKSQILYKLNNNNTKNKSRPSIEGFQFSKDVLDYVAKSDLVISHAGTGSILDALRLSKHLIVVVNHNLMDNHQLEIAGALQKEGYLLVSSAEPEDLGRALCQSSEYAFAQLPSAKSELISNIIASEAGLVSLSI